jgi:hypothetical protein
MHVRTGVAYLASRDPRRLADDLCELREVADYLVVPLSEADLIWSRQTTAHVVEAARQVGLEVWLDPWGVAGVFGGEALSRFLLKRYDAWQLTSDGRRVPIACPRSPALWAFLDEWIEAASACGADGVFWDEPHLWDGNWIGRPDLWGCRCATCAAAYLAEHGEPAGTSSNPTVHAWQGREVLRLVSSLTERGHAAGLRNMVCLVPSPDAADFWPRIAALPWVDSFGTDPYWYDLADGTDYVRTWTQTLLDACEGRCEPHLWLQGFRVPATRELEIARMAELATDLGVPNLAVWSYRGGEQVSSLASDDPDLVWRTVTEAFSSSRLGVAV